VSQCAIGAAESVAARQCVRVPLGRACGDLLELFRAVTDGRSGQGRDHPAAAVLALAAAATVAGMSGYRAIAGWVADVPAGVLADLYMRAGAAPAPAPGKTTIWRVLTHADADALDNAVGTWLSTLLNGETDSDGQALTHLRLDGKTVRGATDSDGNQRHLLAVMAGPPGKAVVTAQSQVDGAKPRESITARDLLARLDLTDTVLTADALHTVKATAELIRSRGGHFVLPVKQNRAALFDALDALPWNDIPIAHSSTQTGHGRITTRTIQTMPAPPDLPFPHVAQVWLIERYVTTGDGKPISAVAQLGVASLDPSHPGRLGPLQPPPVGNRGPALDPRHPLPRRPIPRPHPQRTARHGLTAQPGHRRPTPDRTHGHHRSHPLGLPQHEQAIHHPQPHHVI